MNELLEVIESMYPEALIVEGDGNKVIAYFHDGSITELPERTEFWLEEDENGITWICCRDYWQPGHTTMGSYRWCQL